MRCSLDAGVGQACSSNCKIVTLGHNDLAAKLVCNMTGSVFELPKILPYAAQLYTFDGKVGGEHHHLLAGNILDVIWLSILVDLSHFADGLIVHGANLGFFAKRWAFYSSTCDTPFVDHKYINEFNLFCKYCAESILKYNETGQIIRHSCCFEDLPHHVKIHLMACLFSNDSITFGIQKNVISIQTMTSVKINLIIHQSFLYHGKNVVKILFC